MMFIKENKTQGWIALLICALLLVGAKAFSMRDDSLHQYHQALNSGDILNQFAIAEKLIRLRPRDLGLTYGELDQAKAGFDRLRQNQYGFADPHKLKDARQVLHFSPNAEIALTALAEVHIEIEHQRQKL